MPPSRSHQAGDSSPWEIHRELLWSLWLEQNRKLDYLMKFMADCHQFHAEKWEYEAKFREWNYRKKLRGVDWGIIGSVVAKRKREGKESDVFYHGTQLPSKKVKKESMRNRAHASGDGDHELSSGVAIKSPKMNLADYVRQNKKPSARFSSRPLMPKQESSSGYTDIIPWTLAQSSSNIGLGAFGKVSWTFSSNNDLTLLHSTTWNNTSSVLPLWATRDAFPLRGLPWVKFRTLLDGFGDLTSSVRGAAEYLNGEQPTQRPRSLAFEEAENTTDAVTVLKKQRGASFDLEEVMPEPFRMDVSNSSQFPTTVSKKSFTIQAAGISLFLATNNILSGYQLVDFIRKVFDAGHDHLFEQLFRLKSPTIRAFSCRLLESISQQYSSVNSVTLFRRLLRCGLDRTILTGPTGGRCLQLAIYYNEPLALLLLQTGVQRNPNLGPMEPFNQTPVELSKERSRWNVLRVLLGRDQEVTEAQRSEGEIALRTACTDNNFEKIRSLLNGGVDVDCDRNSSGNETILEWTFFKKRQCYDILLPYSQFSKFFWTTPGILSAADAGREALRTYLACKRCPNEDDDVSLQHAIIAGIQNDLIEETCTILDDELILQSLDLDELLLETVRLGSVEVVTKLLQLGADFSTLDADKRIDFLVDAITDDPDKGCLKDYLENGWFLWDDVFIMYLYHYDRIERESLSHLATFKFLLDQNPNLDSVICTEDCDIITPLQLTICVGNMEMLEHIVDAGVSLNGIAEGASLTALGEAMRTENLGKLKKLKFLLQKGADVKELANDQEATLLELSVSEQSTLYQISKITTDIIQALLEAGADLNGPIRRGPRARWNTALTTAILNPHLDDQIRLFLDLGADIHQIGGGKMARTPLQAAAEGGRMDIVKELLERGAWANAAAAPDDGRTALQAAAENGIVEIARELLKNGARVNALAVPNHGRTALQAACGGGKETREMISLLLEAGADISAPAALRYGRTALQALCSSVLPSSELVAFLIEKGADVNAPPANHGGITALQGAASMGNIKIVILLIDKGAYVNAAPSASEGRMALDGAAEHGRLDTVQLLLEFGATCMAPGNSGYDSAVHFAEENGHFVIADMLRGYKG